MCWRIWGTKSKIMQDKEILSKIEKLLNWYESNHSKAEIVNLLDFQDKLSLLCVNMARMTALSKGNAMRSYFDRKYTFSVNKMSFINAGEGIGKSDEMATASIKLKKDQEVNDIEYSEMLNLMLKQSNRVLSSCQQRISFLKVEWERMHRLTTT